MRLISFISVVIIVCINLSACSTGPKKDASEQELYDDAKKAIKLRNFSQATIALEELEASYPFGKFAEQAQLDLIYARYSGLDLEGAILACDRFIRLHPQSPSVDYAYYTRGIANYSLDVGISSQYFTMVDNSSRDPGHMRLAFKDFSELLTRFPRSAFASDAQQRMYQVRNNLAQYELHAARYYIKREAFIAAANRAAYVVKNFSNTPATEDALIMMVELYNELNLPNQKEDALAVLRANFSKGKAFDEEQNFVPQNKLKQSRSLLSVISLGFFD
jgi:outer membrane protein assembly factor BamD